MWENYKPGDSLPRAITVSKELHDAAVKFSKDKGYPMQTIFSMALISLWRIWNGNTETNESKDTLTELKVKKIFIDNNMPGKLSKTKYMYLAFRGETTFDWMCEIEKLSWFHGMYDGIRRVLTWFLTEQGYLKKKE